ncbi:MAG: AlkZ family DNA glycosylase [Propionibacteriaceae bacterium]|nr:AlkZ family DNA glycosylase [Propionibacteriaceae bacterium]
MEGDSRLLAALRLSAQGLGAQRVGAQGVGAQGVGGVSLSDAAGVVERLLALQAQDYSAGLQATALRGAGLTASAVAGALDAGDLVRTWPMRGTLHLIRPADLAWLLPLGRDRVHRSASGRHRELGLVEADFELAARAARDGLADGRTTRAELLAAIAAAGVSTEGQRGAHLLGVLARNGVVVQTTKDVYARFDEIVPTEAVSREEALARLALRYVAGHGPVTERDLAWWAGLTLTEARAALASVQGRVEVLEVDGTTYFLSPGLEPTLAGIWLLPMFDEYLLGYADRSAQLGGEPLERVVPGRNGMFLPTVVVDGVVAGTWHRRSAKSRVEIGLQLFTELPRRRLSELEVAVARWGEVAGVEAVLAGHPA